MRTAGDTQAAGPTTDPATDPTGLPDRLTLARHLAEHGHPGRAYAMALALHEDARAAADQVRITSTAECLTTCCILLAQYEQGVRFARLARSLAEAQGDVVRTVVAGGALAMQLAWLGEPDAITEAEATVLWAQESAGAADLGWALQAQCLTLVLLGEPVRALPFGERSVAAGGPGATPIWARLALCEALVWTALNSGDADLLAANVARAVALTRDALAIARALGHGWLERLMINNIAEYSLHVGDVAIAAAALAEFAFAAGEPTSRCTAHHNLIRGRLCTARGDHAGALDAILATRALLTAGDLEFSTLCQLDLANAHARLGQFEAALEAHRAYHAVYVRRASDSAQRRARLCALQNETEALRSAATAAQALAEDLAASNELLAQEARRLLKTSLEDPLTGLPNRRRLEMAFLEVLGGGPVALAMIDVDHFKRVNDRFTHPVGDAVLRNVAELLVQNARAQDLVVRFGGEEFVVLFGNVGFTEAAGIAERLRQAVQAHDWSLLRPELAVTVSIGLAGGHEAAAADRLLALADERLYRAKRDGRNRLVTMS